jgi:hypothetical protein
MNRQEITQYLTYTEKGATLTTEFYNLSLYRKYGVIEYLESTGQLDDHKLYDRLVLACLQHSSADLKRDYPVMRERKQRPKSKAADQIEALQALWLHIDRLMEIIFKESYESDG